MAIRSNPFSALQMNRYAFIVFIAGIAVAVSVFFLAEGVPNCLYRSEYGNYFFGADIPRVYQNMTDRWSDFERTKVHPLFPLFVTTPNYALKRILDIDIKTASHVLLSLNSFFWTALLLVILQKITQRIPDAVLLTGFCACTAASVFWLATPETFSFGSTTLLLPLLLLVYPQFAKSSVAQVLAGVVSASMVITNYMASFVAACATLSYRRMLSVALHVLAVLTLLWGIQNMIYPGTVFFLNTRGESRYLNKQGFQNTTQIFLLDSFTPSGIDRTVNPAHLLIPSIESPITVGLAQVRNMGTNNTVVTILLWIACLVLVALGVWQWLHTDDWMKTFGASVMLILFGQFVLHQIYSNETFLYSLHWMPFLVIVISFACRSSKLRVPVLLVVFLVTPVLGTRNFGFRQDALAKSCSDGDSAAFRHESQRIR